MPKRKTVKAAAKRFKKTAGGKVVCARAGSSHLLSSKTRKRKRTLRSKHVLDRAASKRVSAMLG
jgi:large subunit ribosomal protein L35